MPTIRTVAFGLRLLEQADLWKALDVAAEGMSVEFAQTTGQCDMAFGRERLVAKEDDEMVQQRFVNC